MWSVHLIHPCDQAVAIEAPMHKNEHININPLLKQPINTFWPIRVQNSTALWRIVDVFRRSMHCESPGLHHKKTAVEDWMTENAEMNKKQTRSCISQDAKRRKGIYYYKIPNLWSLHRTSERFGLCNAWVLLLLNDILNKQLRQLHRSGFASHYNNQIQLVIKRISGGNDRKGTLGWASP